MLKILKLIKKPAYQKIVSIIAILAVATIGYVLLAPSHAASTSLAVEAESGKLSGSACSVSSSAASGGSYVSFDGSICSSSGGVCSTQTGQFLTRVNQTLCLHGEPYKYGGFDAYSAAGNCAGSDWSQPQMDTYLSGLKPYELTRVSAFSDAADNNNLPLLIQEATKYHQMLILILSDSGSQCGDLEGSQTGQQGGSKSPAWYGGGYETNYIPWVNKVTSEYKNSPAVGMWEIQNEPDAQQVVSTSVTEAFMNAAAAAIKASDPNHLVESGALDWYTWNSCLPESGPNIDVMSMHEYDYDNSGSIVSGHTAQDVACADQYDKPLIVGETGVSVVTGSARASVYEQKFNGYLNYDGATGPIAGVNIWDYSPVSQIIYSLAGTSDPTYPMVANYTAPDNGP